MDIKELRNKAKALEPVVRIGKNGVTEQVILEIIKLLKKKELIKVKMLGNFAVDKDRKEIAEEIAGKTNSMLVDCVGNVVVLFNRKGYK